MTERASLALVALMAAGSIAVLPDVAEAGAGQASNASVATVRHRWTDEDDLVASYLSTYGDGRLLVRRDAIARRLGMSSASLRMRERNFLYIAGRRDGLSHAARRSRRVYARVKDIDEAALRDRVLQIIARR